MNKRITKQKKIKLVAFIASLAVLLVLAVLCFAVPGFYDALAQTLGIEQTGSLPKAQGNSAVGVHFIDVGQGDATLIEDNGEFALIDAGPAANSEALVNYLRAAGVTKLRYLLMTHPHEDHIGGIPAVLEQVEVQQMLLADLAKAPLPTTKTFENMQQALLQHKTPTKTIELHAMYALGQGHLEILQDGLASEDNYNLLSPAIMYRGDGLRLLCTGDAEKANEEALLKSGALLNANLYKAGHHGSGTSNTQGLIDAVAPEVAVISCGENNSYGHPHKGALQRLQASGATVLRTDMQGSVLVRPGPDGALSYGTTRQPLSQAA